MSEVGSRTVEQVTLQTTTGVMLTTDEYNRLTSTRLRAFQVIRRLCGGDARDFDKLEAMLLEDGGESLTTGIAVRVSETDKDWCVSHAHAQGLTLGAWLQKIIDDQLAFGRNAR